MAYAVPRPIIMGLVIFLSFDAVPEVMGEDMILIPSGSYVPFYEGSDKVEIEAFHLDRYPVTNAEFLEFVRANPEWRRSNVRRLFADESYLIYWDTDLDPGAGLDSPVTHVSWFAARAYAQWSGKRLPSLHEWEYAAAAGIESPDARADPGYNQRIINWYSRRVTLPMPPVGSTFRNYWGVYDLHGLIWEWTEDFNSTLIEGDARTGGKGSRNAFCGAGALNVSDKRNYVAFMRFGLRSSLEARNTVSSLGFRCARDAGDTHAMKGRWE